MVETEAEVFLRSRNVLPACRGGDLPSFGADAALLSHEKGPVIFRDCVLGEGTAFVVVFDAVPLQGTLGSEAEKPVKREGSGGGLTGTVSVEVLACSAGTAVGLTEGPFAKSSCSSANFTLSIDSVDLRWVVRRGDFLVVSDNAAFVGSAFSSATSIFESPWSTVEVSDIEAFGVEIEEDGDGLSANDLPEPANLASFAAVESVASSNVSYGTCQIQMQT